MVRAAICSLRGLHVRADAASLTYITSDLCLITLASRMRPIVAILDHFARFRRCRLGAYARMMAHGRYEPRNVIGAGTPVSEGLVNGLYIIPILAVLILVHEIGHFVAAGMIGVKVEEFGIGIPPRLKGWRHKGVLWSLNWIPFGGFVKVLGEDGKADDPESINAKRRASAHFSSSPARP